MNERGALPPVPGEKLKRFFLIVTGFLSLTLGVLGVFLPLLPTTPFVLLAAACFMRSSERLHAWLLGQRFLGNRIRCYRLYKAIPLRAKVVSLLLLWLTIGYSIFFVVRALWLEIVLLVIAAAVSLHLLCFRTLTRAMLAELENGAAEPEARGGAKERRGQASSSR